MMNEKISVIVPLHNVQDYLDTCIASIAEQTYSNIEIILVDDGSVDDSPQICDRWAQKDHRIRVIHKEKEGISVARNTALDLCTSEWITFVDSDDWIHHETLEKMMQAARHESAKLVMASYRRVKDGESVTVKPIGALSYEVVNAEDAIRLLYTGNIHQTVAWAKLYHRSLWERHRFPVGKRNEDEFTTYKLMYEAGKIVHATDEIYFYRTRQGSMMDDPDRIRNADIFEALWERQEFFEKHELDELAVININFLLDRLMDRAAVLKKKQESMVFLSEYFDKIRKYKKEITTRNKLKQQLFAIDPRLYGKLVQWWKKRNE